MSEEKEERQLPVVGQRQEFLVIPDSGVDFSVVAHLAPPASMPLGVTAAKSSVFGWRRVSRFIG
jgi:hypothetical protein